MPKQPRSYRNFEHRLKWKPKVSAPTLVADCRDIPAALKGKCFIVRLAPNGEARQITQLRNSTPTTEARSSQVV